MNNLEIATLFSSLVSILGLWILWFYFYRDYCIDKFRQEVFSLRDGLFDYADSDGISFDHPIYGMLRSTMNGFIRFAEDLTLFRFVALNIVISKEVHILSGFSYEAQWSKNIESLSTNQKMQLETFRKKMIFIVAKHFIRSSPIVLVIITPFILVAVVIFAFDQLIHFLKSQMDNLSMTALEIGQQTV